MIDVTIPPDRADEVQGADCQEWLMANATGSITGYVDGDGRFILRFSDEADAEAFRARWSERLKKVAKAKPTPDHADKSAD